ncbi:MAG: hypothetical protein ACOCVY_02960 [Patescibacteria group bacterium]
MPPKIKIILTVGLLAFFASFLPSEGVSASEDEDNFDPNNIISDQEVLDHDSMSKEDIQRFLEEKGGHLSEYKHKNPDTDEELSASEIIYNRATANKISPKFLLVLLQKEQSLIEDKDPSQGQLDWATGYGCPDGGDPNTRWKGFWKQVNSASLQFYDYIENPHLYNFRKGESYTFDNPYSKKEETNVVVPANNATAALYNYTPHVYDGNYNFYKTWNRYFTKTYPDGSLLSAEGEPGVWLIKGGMKKPFQTQTALTSRFDKDKVIQVSKSTLSKYPKGAPVKFPNYSLVRSPDGSIYLLVDNKKRKIANHEAFKSIGFHPQEIMNASWADIRSYTNGEPLTTTSTYPTGALVQNKNTGGIYWVYEGKKHPVLDRIFLETKFANKSIIPAENEKLDKYKTGEPIVFDNGELLTSPKDPGVYLIVNGKKRAFISAEVFTEMGYQWKNIITVPENVLDLYEEGEKITKEGMK